MSGPFVGIDSLATHFGVSVSTLRHWIRAKKIPDTCYIKIGLTYRFHLEATQEALINYKHQDGMTDEQRAEEASKIIDSLEAEIPDDKPKNKPEAEVEEAEAELESKVRGVPNLKPDAELDDELAGILNEHDDLEDL